MDPGYGEMETDLGTVIWARGQDSGQERRGGVGLEEAAEGQWRSVGWGKARGKRNQDFPLG